MGHIDESDDMPRIRTMQIRETINLPLDTARYLGISGVSPVQRSNLLFI